MSNRFGIVIGSALVVAWLAVCPAGNASTASGQDQPTAVDKKVTLNLENADLRYALKLLFTSAGVNYTLDQAVQGTVTGSQYQSGFGGGLGGGGFCCGGGFGGGGFGGGRR